MPAIRARVLTPRSQDEASFIPDAYVHWNSTGTIEAVSHYRGQPVEHDVYPALLTPGFVDGHIHFPQTRIIGSASGPLLPWLEASVFPEEARFADPVHAHHVAEVFTQQLIRSGTTCSLVYGSVHPQATDILLQMAADLGLRMTAGPVLMDCHCPEDLQLPTQLAMEGIRKLASKWHGYDQGRLGVAVIPRFALSCSAELMSAAAEVADELGLWVSTHLSENRDECAIATKRFGTQDYLQVYEDLGLVHQKSVYAHCIHLSHSELDRMADRRAVVAHCPDSNFFLGSGNMPIKEMLARDIPLCIGSDVAAGRSFSIPKNASAVYDNAILTGYNATPEELFWWSTAGGAHSLGHEQLGKIEPGYEADFACFSQPHWVDNSTASLAWLLLNRDLPDTIAVWVRGRKLTIKS